MEQEEVRESEARPAVRPVTHWTKNDRVVHLVVGCAFATRDGKWLWVRDGYFHNAAEFWQELRRLFPGLIPDTRWGYTALPHILNAHDMFIRDYASRGFRGETGAEPQQPWGGSVDKLPATGPIFGRSGTAKEKKEKICRAYHGLGSDGRPLFVGDGFTVGLVEYAAATGISAAVLLKTIAPRLPRAVLYRLLVETSDETKAPDVVAEEALLRHAKEATA